jgi:hypothetical protein
MERSDSEIFPNSKTSPGVYPVSAGVEVTKYIFQIILQTTLRYSNALKLTIQIITIKLFNDISMILMENWILLEMKLFIQ